jgi:hypothetical protein
MEVRLSTVAQKSGHRTAVLRARAQPDLTISRRQPANSIGWDDDAHVDTNAVFLPVTNAESFIDQMDRCIADSKLHKLEHQFLNGGVLVRFRRKRDADVFRQAMAE